MPAKALSVDYNLSFNKQLKDDLALKNLAEALTQQQQNEKEAVRSIFIWVAQNIKYDFESVFTEKIKNQDVETVLKTKKAVCAGYSNLFDALCKKAGIKSRVITGYSKGFGYQPNSRFNISNHSWNAVYIEGKWQLLDVTWASPHAVYSIVSKPVAINFKYFLSNPADFIKDHLPEDPLWQLLPNAVSLEDFEKNQFDVAGIAVSTQKTAIDSIAFYDKMDAYNREIFYYERVQAFNKNNKSATYRLGIAYLYKSLDTLEVIDKLTYHNIFKELPRLEIQNNQLLEKSASYFRQFVETDEYYAQTKELLIETDYQKGVFQYEAAMLMLKLLHDMDEKEYRKSFTFYKKEMGDRLKKANTFFENIPDWSRYFSDSKAYIEKYIPDVYKMLNQNY